MVSLGDLEGPRDAAVDAGGDATDAQDASDAGDASTAPDGPFCAAHADASFCEDFDDDAVAFGARWSGTTVSGDGSALGPTSSRFVSSPVSAAIHVSAADAGLAIARLEKAFPSTAQNVQLDFDVYLVARPTIANVDLVDITVGELEFSLLLEPGRDQGREEYTAPDGGYQDLRWIAATPLPAGKWTHVTLSMTLGASGTVTLAYDSVAVRLGAWLSATAPAVPDLQMGLAFEQAPRDAQDINVDNVVIEVK